MPPSGRVRLALVAVLFALVSAPFGPVLAQSPAGADAEAPPETRQEALRRLRRDRVPTTQTYESGRVERLLARLENEQTIENLFGTPSPSTGGAYLTLGNITTGAGLTLGTGYNGRAILGRQVELSVRGAISSRVYWLGEVEAALPRLASGRAFADFVVRRWDYTQEDFFGPGPNSRLEDRSNFRHQQTTVEAEAGMRLSRWLSVGGGTAFLNPSIGPGKDKNHPSIEELYTDLDAPGLSAQPDFVRPRVFAELDFATPVDNPRTGGRYLIAYSYFADQQLDRYSFERWEFDLRQYVSFLRGRRVLAFRGLASFSDPRAGNTVPFYLQQTLGGSRTLRGFRDFRFRDRHLILAQAEYRFEVFPALDVVLFYDAGKVAPLRRQINFEDWESNFGPGFRIGTDNGVLFRVDWALGSRDGQHVMIKFSNVF